MVTTEKKLANDKNRLGTLVDFKEQRHGRYSITELYDNENILTFSTLNS
jgi:hypothetical protein